jgi:ectoine hydroxylase-related dioxygenase (phytanoyl-CoA dioxygenase family)
MRDIETARFASSGAELFKAAFSPDLAALRDVLAKTPPAHAGVRLHGIAGLRPFLSAAGCIGSIAGAVLGPDAIPVRALLFDKTPDMNWSLAWHQDRTISVRERREVDGFGPWTMKSGMHHVAPPFEVLSRMVTIRAHLDDVPADNAPLLVAPGSHRFGRILVREVEDIVRRCGTLTCLAEAGDVWLYATPILHASAAALNAGRRRVLQVDFAAEALPGGLSWLGV